MTPRHKLTTAQLFLTDPEAKFSKSIGWTRGERTGRYAIVIDHGKVTYAENEPGGDVTVSVQMTAAMSKTHVNNIQTGLQRRGSTCKTLRNLRSQHGRARR